MNTKINDQATNDSAEIQQPSGVGLGGLSGSTFVMVPMTDEEWMALLSQESSTMPETIRFNIENRQWDLLDKNLYILGERIKKLRRILLAKIDPGFVPSKRQRSPMLAGSERNNEIK